MEERQPEKRNDKNNDRPDGGRRNRNRHRNRGNRSGGQREEKTPSAKPEEIMAYVDDEPFEADGQAEPADPPKTPVANPRQERSNRAENGRPDTSRQNGNGRDNDNRTETGRQQPNQREKDRDRNRDKHRDRDSDRDRAVREESVVAQEWNREDELRPGDLRPGESRMGEMRISDLAGRGVEGSSEERLVVGITLGDYNGIGPEVILKALKYNQLQRVCTPVIYGSMRVLNRYRNLLNLKDWNLNGIQHIGQASHKMTNVITCWNENAKPAPPQANTTQPTPETEPTGEGQAEPTATAPVAPADVPSTATVTQVEASATATPAQPVYEIQPGKVTPEAGQAALACLQRAVEDLKAGKLDALITGPINKHNIQSESFKFPGHTEYLAQAFGVPDDLMFMVGETLRVGVVTGHVPLGRVRQHVTRNAINQKLTMMMQSLRQDFGIQKPRIAVLGLNPHAGENGLLGNEEQEVIIPVVEDWRKKGELVYGPFPADGFFGTRNYRKYDAVLAMYHDQGLIPFKAIAFDEGVNFTAGLPIVRTSPDHGTAYDIAGKNLADETSMTQAIYLACDVARRRKEYKEAEVNALKK